MRCVSYPAHALPDIGDKEVIFCYRSTDRQVSTRWSWKKRSVRMSSTLPVMHASKNGSMKNVVLLLLLSTSLLCTSSVNAQAEESSGSTASGVDEVSELKTKLQNEQKLNRKMKDQISSISARAQPYHHFLAQLSTSMHNLPEQMQSAWSMAQSTSNNIITAYAQAKNVIKQHSTRVAKQVGLEQYATQVNLERFATGVLFALSTLCFAILIAALLLLPNSYGG